MATRQIGPYEVLEEIGRGAIGVVFRARAPDGRVVAIKLVTSLDESRLERFDRERRLLGSLDEEAGFVPLLDAGVSPHGPYLVMPFAEGGTLGDRLRRGALGVDETVRLGRQLASALGRAHARGIVHRDLKPDNVLFTGSGRALVADLGVAKHFRPDATGASQSVSLTHDGALVGTALYMAPEQIENARDAGPRADVFSLGAILHECLAGRPAFAGSTILEVLANIETGSRETLPRLRPGTPAWLVAVVDRALSLDPEERFADGRELASALAGAPRRRAPLVPGAVAIAALAAAVVLGLAFVRPGRRAQLAREELARAQGSLARARPGDAIDEATRAIELDPTLASAWLVRAEARCAGKDYQGALEDGTRAIALDARSGAAWRCRGVARARTGDPRGAIADLDRSLALDPGDLAATLERGDALEKAGKRDEAIAGFERAVALDARSATAWSRLGTALYERVLAKGRRSEKNFGDADRGVAALTHAIELDPGLSGCFLTRAYLRQGRGDDDGAIADFTRATAVEPGLALAWAERGMSRALKDEIPAALEDCRRATELEPRLARVWFCSGFAKSRSGDSAGAIADYSRAVDLEPGNALTLAERGLERALHGEPGPGILDCTRAIELEPLNGALYAKRAGARSGSGQRDAMIEDLERALELSPDSPSVPLLRSEIERLKARR